FGKSLLEKVMMNHPLTDRVLDQLFSITDEQNYFNALPPIFFSNILAYITSHYNGHHQEMLFLKKKTRGDDLQIDWMNKWYSKSQEFSAPKYRNDIKNKILKYVDSMNAEDIQTMKQSFSEAYFKQG